MGLKDYRPHLLRPDAMIKSDQNGIERIHNRYLLLNLRSQDKIRPKWD